MLFLQCLTLDCSPLQVAEHSDQLDHVEQTVTEVKSVKHIKPLRNFQQSLDLIHMVHRVHMVHNFKKKFTKWSLSKDCGVCQRTIYPSPVSF